MYQKDNVGGSFEDKIERKRDRERKNQSCLTEESGIREGAASDAETHGRVWEERQLLSYVIILHSYSVM